MNINRNPYAAEVDAMTGGDFALLEQAVAARSCRERVGCGTFDEAAPRMPALRVSAHRQRRQDPGRAPQAQVRCLRCALRRRGRVWIDEAYVNDTDLSKGCGQARKRGLSKQKICIAIAIDASKNPVAVVCGHGKPSAKRIKAALGSHLAEGSTVVHDKERAHNGVIADRKCGSEAYKADVTDPAYLEEMAMVNNLSSWFKRYLWRFTGMDPANLQSYLDWFVYLFRVRQAEEKWPKTARVVRHLMMADATYRT